MSGGLQAELKQTKPFENLETEAVLSIARTAAVLEHSLAQALKPYDLTPTQYNVLRILRGSGPDGLCRSEIGERMVTRVPDVTRLLDRMEETGLITRARSGDDWRYVTTKIARKGLDLVNKLDAPLEAHNRAVLGHLGRRNLRALVDALAEARRKT